MKVPDEDSDERFRFFHSGDAAFSADRKLFVLCQGLTALLFDVATGKEVRALKTELRELALALSPDGNPRTAIFLDKAEAIQDFSLIVSCPFCVGVTRSSVRNSELTN